MLDYDAIKELSRTINRSAKDLIALTPQNDPFYAGLSYRKQQAEWFGKLWNRFDFSHGIHIRRIHYRLISESEDGEPVLKPDGELYLNTTNDWILLNRAALAARYLGVVPSTAFVDRRNDEPRIYAPEFGKSTPWIWVEEGYVRQPSVEVHSGYFPHLPSFDMEGLYTDQDYVVEVWIEKSTLNDWLLPLCKRCEVNLVVGIGEISEIACRLLVERTQRTGAPTRILYISDFDPAGRSMPLAAARKIEFLAQKLETPPDITLQPIILTEEQCIRYRLPRTPLKETERRKASFEKNFGVGATELDALEALHPGEAKDRRPGWPRC